MAFIYVIQILINKINSMEPSITFKKHIETELNILTESIAKGSEFNIKTYIESRLKKYSDDHHDNFEALKDYFNQNTDIVQPTNAQEEDEAYMKLLNDFLVSQGY